MHRINSIALIVAALIYTVLPSRLEAALWVQTTQEDFLSGTLEGIDASIVPGALRILEGKYRKVWSTRDDFQKDVSHQDVEIGEGNVVLSKYKITLHNPLSRPALTSGHVTWVDPTNGEVYVCDRRGVSIIHRDGTSFTYHGDGVWDTTTDYDGVLVSARPRVYTGRGGAFRAWKDIQSGDIYFCAGKAGLRIIHTQNTPTFADDTVDTLDTGTRPGILRWDPDLSWKDEEGNVYIGFHHFSGFTIVHPDSTSTTYTENGVYDNTYGRKLISWTPRLGTWSTGSALLGLDDKAHPYCRTEEGLLYVGTNKGGLTVYHWNSDLGRYDTSVTYRSTGLWDTTEDNVGTLIDSTKRIAGDSIWYVWQDRDGNMYVNDGSGLQRAGSVIRPDGTVHRSPLGRCNHGWQDEEGNIYLSRDDGFVILHPDGTETTYDAITFLRGSWMDFQGNLYIGGDGQFAVMSPNRRGRLTSPVTELNGTSAPSIRWDYKAPLGSKVFLQTRTGAATAYWVHRFEGGDLPKVIIESGSVDVRSGDSGALFGGFSSPTSSFLIDLGDDFPKGSVIKIRLKPILPTEEGLLKISLSGERSTDERHIRYETLRGDDRWVILTYVSEEVFSRVRFVPVSWYVRGFEIAWISIELPTGWTDWVDLPHPNGSVILNVGQDHPYLQWRAILTTENPRRALPVLEQVELVSDYPAQALYTSPAFHTQAPPTYQTLSWDGETPEGTSLKLQIRTASTEVELRAAPWLGPTDAERYYTVSGTRINPLHKGDRWVQYRAFLETTDSLKTPVLREVRIAYDVITQVAETDVDHPLPRRTFLAQNVPNPFNAMTTIGYQLSKRSEVKLEIFDLLGREVRTWVKGTQDAGYYKLIWDGRTDQGMEVASGVYWYRLKVGDFSETHKMILLR